MRQPTRDELSQAEAALKRGVLVGLMMMAAIWLIAMVLVMLIVAKGLAG